MAFAKQFPIRTAIPEDTYDFLIEALRANENDFEGSIADDARALREKIEKYGRRVTDENGAEVIRLGFYEKEGVKFIWQFLAASKVAADYRELMNYTDKVCAENNLAETENEPTETEGDPIALEV